jgi:hypothetical protein
MGGDASRRAEVHSDGGERRPELYNTKYLTPTAGGPIFGPYVSPTAPPPR